jgi:hypothetical protein
VASELGGFIKNGPQLFGLVNSLGQPSLFMYSFTVQDDLKWNAILKKYHIQDSTWAQTKSEYLDESPKFNPKIIDDAPYQEFHDLNLAVYDYCPKTLTYPQAKRMFRTYVRRGWNVFCAQTLVEVCCKIAFAIQSYNH